MQLPGRGSGQKGHERFVDIFANARPAGERGPVVNEDVHGSTGGCYHGARE